eukprot:1143483-Pelagomonas_calceolata.AAC.4
MPARISCRNALINSLTDHDIVFHLSGKRIDVCIRGQKSKTHAWQELWVIFEVQQRTSHFWHSANGGCQVEY